MHSEKTMNSGQNHSPISSPFKGDQRGSGGALLRPRPADGHKGTFGHALLVSGKYGMAGAAVLAARACLRSGVGKVSVAVPQRNNDILQIAVPEAILVHDRHAERFTTPIATDSYQAVAIGPGLGTADDTAQALHAQLLLCQGKPLVLDADALNILSLHPEWAADIPGGTILTPHEGELRRLTAAGIDTGRFVLVHKGHPTQIIADGQTWLCPWGNDGMATAGSGDVLTGIIAGLLAQGYPPCDAALLGVSLHALSGDAATAALGAHSVTASDLIAHLPEAFLQIGG